MSRRWRWGAILLGGLLAFSALSNLVEHLTPKPHGPRSSSYATSPEGLAAYASLLAAYDYPVHRVREPPAERPLDPGDTAILLDPGAVPPQDIEALREFVRQGGRLVVGGESSDFWLHDLLDRPPGWSSSEVRRARPVVPVPETSGVGEVEAAGPGVWSEAGQALPVIAGDGGPTVAVTNLGRGRVVLLADPSPLQNRLLDHADNSALGLAVAGARGRRVDFLEGVHGYEPATGLAAIPWSWRLALGGLIVAALVLMLARGRRLGPPETESRELAPPRRAYVESLAALLARTKRPAEAIESVRAEGKRLLTQRGQLDDDPDEEALRRVGRRAGLTDEEIAGLLGTAPGKAGVLAAGRALVKLETVEGRTS